MKISPIIIARNYILIPGDIVNKYIINQSPYATTIMTDIILSKIEGLSPIVTNMVGKKVNDLSWDFMEIDNIYHYSYLRNSIKYGNYL